MVRDYGLEIKCEGEDTLIEYTKVNYILIGNTLFK